MAEKSSRFVSLDKPIDKFIEEQKTKTLFQKHEEIVSLLTKSPSAKSEARRFVDIPPE